MPRNEFTYAVGFELTLAAAGVLLLWIHVLRRQARVSARPSSLQPWNASLPDFLVFLVMVMASSFAFAVAASSAVKFLPLRGDEVTVFNGAAAQLGMLVGVGIFALRPGRAFGASSSGTRNIFLSGGVTFLVSLPVLIATATAWESVLKLCKLPTEKQDLIGMFVNAESPWLLGIMLTLAIVIAPLTEELVFRAGLFRYLRTRVPHWAALTLPALFFATLHVNWNTLQGLSSLAPLTVLAVIFSLAYERTGQLGTPIVAHALFNLNTVVLIFSGVDL
jgi:uncharacterized protein